MKKDKPKRQAFIVHLPQDTWLSLKHVSADQRRTMGAIVTECVNNYMNKLNNKLTNESTSI